jgi:hypothetical protein
METQQLKSTPLKGHQGMDPRERTTAAALADPANFGTYRKTAITRARQMDAPFTVATTEGVMEGKAGDYLCLDTKGNPYPCAREVFEASYEQHLVEFGVAR